MTFVLTDRNVASHSSSDMNCNAGWCSPSNGTPVPYPHSCGGVVHGDFDHQDDTGWFVHAGCDSCGFAEIVHHGPSELFDHDSDVSVVQTIDPGKAPAKKATKKAAKKAPAKKAAKR